MKKLVTTIIRFEEFIKAFKRFLDREIGSVNKIETTDRNIIFTLANRRIQVQIIERVFDFFSNFVIVKIILDGFNLNESKVIENFIKHMNRILQA